MCVCVCVCHSIFSEFFFMYLYLLLYNVWMTSNGYILHVIHKLFYKALRELQGK